jgi:hypothetical protein
MASLINSLRDDFADNLVANAWESVGTIGSATRTEASGRATLTLPSSTAGYHEASYYSVGDYDITGDGCWINIHAMVATGVAASAYFRLRRDANNYLEWTQTSNTIQARYILNGVATSLHSATWSATTYKYLRIRESGGTVTFESSSNGSSWTSRGTVTVATFGAVTALYVWFGATCGNVASPGSFVVEEFNTLSLATNWRWVEAARQEMHRIGSVSLAASAGVGYLAIASSIDASGNLVSPRYFAGPCGQGEELTEQASQAAAQAMAVNLPSAGRWYLPKGVFVEGRYIRLFLRATSGSFTLREFYPRRFVQADDIEAESIRTRLLAAGAVTADKISVLQLSAITADMGSLTAGTITGALIRTAASGARVQMDSTGIFGTDGTTTQWSANSSTGKLTAGGGNVVLDGNGFSIATAGTYNISRSISFLRSAVAVARMYMLAGGSFDQITLDTNGDRQGVLTLNAAGAASLSYDSASLSLAAENATDEARITLSATNLYSYGGLHLATNAINEVETIPGWLRASGGVQVHNGSAMRYRSAYYIDSIGNQAIINAYDDTGAVYRPMQIDTGTLYLVPNSGAYVRIGDGTLPSYRLELPNTASASGQGRANAWVTYSSKTRKRQIADLPRQQTRQLIKALRAVSFDWEEGGRDVGLIAEEVLQVAPDLVSGDPTKPDTLALKLDRVALLLLPIVQELLEDVAALKRAA